MKKLGVVLGVLAVLVIGTIVIVPKLVSMENVKQEIKKQVHDTTGRDISFGDMKFVFFPNIGVELNDVSLSNAKWAKDKTMVRLKKMNVQLALKPLFQKQIEVQKFVLKSPDIHLEVAADGKANWDFSSAAKKAATNEAEGGSSATKDLAFKFSDMQITDGSVSFVNRQTGVSETLDGIDLLVHYPDLSSPLHFDGVFKYKGKRVDLMLDAAKPLDFMAGKPTPGHVEVKTEALSFKAEGFVALKDTFLKGKSEFNVVSLYMLSKWLTGKEMKLPFEKVTFRSNVEVNKKSFALKQAELSLDDVDAKGDVSVALTGKPNLQGKLSLNKLNLDRFTQGAQAADAGYNAGSAQADEDWDDTPFDVSALKKFDADLVLETQGFSLKDADVGASTLNIKLHGGNLHFTSSEASLFDGKFKSDLTLNATSATPSMTFDFDMKDVEAKPILTTFANFKKLSGKTDAKVSVRSVGGSQRQMIANLAGDGSVMFKNGALEGIDLANIAKMIQSKLMDMGVGEGKTEFVQMGGTFTIKQGVAVNDDFKVKGPLVQASGQGNIDLPRKYIQYRVTPILTASSDVEGAKGIGIPVDIKGPFSHIKIKPDYASLVQRAINNPEGVRKSIKNLKGQLGDIKNLKKDPAKLINGLFGGNVLPHQEEPVPATEPAPVTTPDTSVPVAPQPDGGSVQAPPVPAADVPATTP